MRKEALRHKKKKSHTAAIVVWAFVFAFTATLVAFLYALVGAYTIIEIFANKYYWMTLGVANGLLVIGYLMVYRIDAQNIALKENDLEDTEWLTPKRLRKMKEYTVIDWDKVK